MNPHVGFGVVSSSLFGAVHDSRESFILLGEAQDSDLRLVEALADLPETALNTSFDKVDILHLRELYDLAEGVSMTLCTLVAAWIGKFLG